MGALNDLDSLRRGAATSDGGQHILIYGSGELVHTLMQHDLIDEYRLMVFPVVLGRGKRFFKDGSDTSLTLVDAKTTSSGVAILTYQPAIPAA